MTFELMRRREFLQSLVAAGVVTGVAGSTSATLSLAGGKISIAKWLRKTREYNERRILERNYGAVREHFTQLVSQGHEIARLELGPARDRFRQAKAFTSNGAILTWAQPWAGDQI
jgi:hypothetical protein